MIHPTLKDKISKIVKEEEDLARIMDYIYWEVAKLQGKTDKASVNKVRLLVKKLKYEYKRTIREMEK